MQSLNSCQLDVADLGPSDASDLVTSQAGVNSNPSGDLVDYDPDGAINEVNELGEDLGVHNASASDLVPSQAGVNLADLDPSEGGAITEISALEEDLRNRLKELSDRVMDNILSNKRTLSDIVDIICVSEFTTSETFFGTRKKTHPPSPIYALIGEVWIDKFYRKNELGMYCEDIFELSGTRIIKTIFWVNFLDLYNNRGKCEDKGKIYKKLKYFVEKNIFKPVLSRMNKVPLSDSQGSSNSQTNSSSASFPPVSQLSSQGSSNSRQISSGTSLSSRNADTRLPSGNTELDSQRESIQSLAPNLSSRFLYRAYVFKELTEKIGCTEKPLDSLYRRYNQVWSQSHFEIEGFKISEELSSVHIKKIEDLAFAMLNSYDKHPIILERNVGFVNDIFTILNSGERTMWAPRNKKSLILVYVEGRPILKFETLGSQGETSELANVFKSANINEDEDMLQVPLHKDFVKNERTEIALTLDVYGNDLHSFIRQILSMFERMKLDTFQHLYDEFICPKRKSTHKKSNRSKKRSTEDSGDDEEESEAEDNCEPSNLRGFLTLDKLILLRTCLSNDIRADVAHMFVRVFRWGYYGHTIGHLRTTVEDNMEGGNNLPVSLNSAIMAALNLIKIIKRHKIEGMLRAGAGYMEEGFVDIALLKNSESFKNTAFEFLYDNVDINVKLVDLVNAKFLEDGNYFSQFTSGSSSIRLNYYYSDIMRMTELKRHHMIILCTACVGMLFTLKLVWLGTTKPSSPTRFLIIDLLSNGNNLLEFIALITKKEVKSVKSELYRLGIFRKWMTSYVQTVECESGDAYANKAADESTIFKFSADDPIMPVRECSGPQSQNSASTMIPSSHSQSSIRLEGQEHSSCDIGSASAYSPSDGTNDDDDDDDDDTMNDQDNEIQNENESGGDVLSQQSDVSTKFQRDMWILDIHGLIAHIASSSEMTNLQKIENLRSKIEGEIFHRVDCNEKAKLDIKRQIKALHSFSKDDKIEICCPNILKERFMPDKMRLVSKSQRKTIPKCLVSFKGCISHTIESLEEHAVEYAFHFFNNRCYSIDHCTGILGLEGRFRKDSRFEEEAAQEDAYDHTTDTNDVWDQNAVITENNNIDSNITDGLEYDAGYDSDATRFSDEAMEACVSAREAYEVPYQLPINYSVATLEDHGALEYLGSYESMETEN